MFGMDVPEAVAKHVQGMYIMGHAREFEGGVLRASSTHKGTKVRWTFLWGTLARGELRLCSALPDGQKQLANERRRAKDGTEETLSLASLCVRHGRDLTRDLKDSRSIGRFALTKRSPTSFEVLAESHDASCLARF